MKRIYGVGLLSILATLCVLEASAYEYENEGHKIKFTGFGTIGVLNPEFKKDSLLVGDWSFRGYASYDLNQDIKVGATYALDEWAVYQGAHSADAIMFIESATMGRVELGLADSVVTKIAVGLPDVGGLRINQNPLFFKKITPDHPIISITPLMSGRYNMRANYITAPTRPLQFAASVAGLTEDYKYNLDFGLKYRSGEGKTKVAANFGASYIDTVTGMQTDIFGAPVVADWRGQLSAGLNLQYNSWIWGTSVRMIYDKNPVIVSDGLFVGTGVSYDVLKYSLSATYMLSSTGIWQEGAPNNNVHTGMASFRYKYSEKVDCWISTGITVGTPFISAGIRAKI